MEVKNKFYILADLAQYPASTPEEIAERLDRQFDDRDEDVITTVRTYLGKLRNDGKIVQYHGEGGVRGRGGDVTGINRSVDESDELWVLTQKGYDDLKQVWEDICPIHRELVDALSVGARFVPPHVVQGDSEE